MLLLGCSLIGGRGAVLEELAPLHCVTFSIVSTKDSKHDSLAEWSKALASGASPQGRGFEPHSCQIQRWTTVPEATELQTCFCHHSCSN